MHTIIIDHRLVDPGIPTFIMVGCKTLLICIAGIKKCIYTSSNKLKTKMRFKC